MSFALRPAILTDAPSLALLAERTFRDTFAARNSPGNMDLYCAKHFSTDIQAAEIADRGLVTTLALEDDRYAGFSQLVRSKAHPNVAARRPAELNRLYVGAEWHGLGIGSALMKGALASAKATGADCLWLGVWEHNPNAMAFYRKFGFEIVGSHAFLLGLERQRDLIMSVALG